VSKFFEEKTVYLSVEELKKLYFESHFQHLKHFRNQMADKWPPSIDIETILNWNAEKKEWMAQKQKKIDVDNSGQGYGEAVNGRMDLMSYLQEKLLQHAVKNNLNLKEIGAIVETMETLTKIQDRTARQFGGGTITVSEYDVQKSTIDSLLDEAIAKTEQQEPEDIPDELETDNPHE
jgi:hypothetical protein